jgi:peptidoglycan hydrolase-like protein with peptidoglycan-binding domain
MEKLFKLILSWLRALFGGKKNPAPKPVEAPKKWENGKQDEDVKAAQKKLIHLGHEFSGGSDGLLGDHTRTALEDFKADLEIEEEGIGDETLAALEEEHAKIGFPEDLEMSVGDDDDDFEGEKVTEFQEKLMALGHALPRFGADGDFGDESLVATKEFQLDHPDECGDEDAFDAQGVGPKTYAAVLAAEPPKEESKPFIPPPPATGLPGNPPAGMIVTKDDHPLKKGRGTRKLADIVGVTLHQTACTLGEKEHRYANVACHIAITREGKIIYNNDFIKKIWHGNGFNTRTIGIEIDGHFAGLEAQSEDGEWVPDLRTYWRPKNSTRTPLSITPAQVEACKEAIRWCKRVVDGAGGDFKYIVAHRQSSPSRVSDPGEKTWRLVAVPLLDELGMSDGGDDYYITDSKKRPGKPLPEEWDPSRHKGVSYRARSSAKGRGSSGPPAR